MHAVPLALGDAYGLRFAFQPWTYLDEECEWGELDAWTAYREGGNAISQVNGWRCPVAIPDQLLVMEDSEVTGYIYFWIWALRRALWRDLVEEGLLAVRLNHYPDWREGQGPTLWISASEGAPDLDPGDWRTTEDSLVLAAGDWPLSDILAFEGDPLFMCPDLSLNKRSYSDLDPEGAEELRLEYSFEAEFEIQCEPAATEMPAWTEISPQEQTACVADLLSLRAAADALWTEDLLACIAVHPGTYRATIVESGILEALIAREAVMRSPNVDETIKAMAALSTP